MSAVESRNLGKPHETRQVHAHGRMDVVTLGESGVSRP
jgi:hypothetical protein